MIHANRKYDSNKTFNGSTDRVVFQSLGSGQEFAD